MRAKVLVNHGADSKTPDTVYGDTPLHHAAFWGDSTLGTLLITSGADVNARSLLNGQTPLFYAAHHGKVEFVKLLVANGADVTVKDKSGENALKMAVDPARELLRSLGLKE